MNKSIFILLLAMLIQQQISTAQAFVTTWQSDNEGTSSDTQITIPTSGEGYNYSIYWEEIGNNTHHGTVSNITGNHTIEFGSIGTYLVEITGEFPRIYFNDTGDKSKILTVEAWGTIAWSSMESAFRGCNNLTIPATDPPDLREVLDMSFMFSGATSFNQPIEYWDVSYANNMSQMFHGATSFNQPIGAWFVRNVTNMSGMFSQAISFNQPIEAWDLANITDVSEMFSGAISFNQPIGDWNLFFVINMSKMFSGATRFNQPIGNWDLYFVSNMSQMFNGATSFNQPLDNWNVGSVTTMSNMFSNASSFDQSIANWDVSNVTVMNAMLDNTNLSRINYDLTIQRWATLDVQPGVSLSASGLNYCASTTAREQLIGKGWSISGDIVDCSQYITFDALEPKSMGDPAFDLTASANSVLPVSYESSNTEVATISEGTVSLVGVGTTTITANQNGNEDFYPAIPVEQTLIVNIGDQSIMFEPLESKTYIDPVFDLTATASSGLPVTYESSNTDVALVSGNMVSIVGIGTTTITAKQDGNGNFNPAPSIEQPLTVNKSDQSIMFGALGSKTFVDPAFDLTATASSGLDIAYESSNTAVATISGSTVTIVGIGTTIISANQEGNVNFNPAISVEQALAVTKLIQTIDFGTLDIKRIDDSPFKLTATASSGLPVNFESSNTDVATVSGNTVTIIGAGTTIITARQAGDDDYQATDIEQTLTVNKYTQIITFGTIESKNFNDPDFDLTAIASSGLPVTYQSSNTDVSIVSGNTVTILGGGTTTITAIQAGDGNYEAATSIEQTLTINRAQQTITFKKLENKGFGDPSFELGATSSSGLSISYASSNTNVATISGSTVTIVGAGTTDIMATQSGDNNYQMAAPVEQMLTVSKADQSITFGALEAKDINDPVFELNAMTSSGLSIAYESSNIDVATVSQNAITIVGPGTTIITATQEGNSNYNPATSVEQILEVNTVLSVFDEQTIINVYPNPIVDELIIQSETFQSAIIRELSGRMVLRSSNKNLDVRELKSGVYILTLIQKSKEQIDLRIIKE